MDRLDAITLLKQIRESFNIATTSFVSLDMNKLGLWTVVLSWVPDQHERTELETFAKKHNVKVETKNNLTTFSNLE